MELSVTVYALTVAEMSSIQHWMNLINLNLCATQHSLPLIPWYQFLGGLSLHLNHLIASHAANYNWPFGTLPFGLFGSNLDTRGLETYPRTYSGHSRAI